MQKEVYAAATAALANLENISNDRIEALTRGHGMTNIAAMAAANAITTEVLRGANIKLTDEDAGYLQIDDVLAKGIAAAREAGADGANAALFAATICYFAGSNAQAGVPAGNRKLGALARMIAGLDRAGVASIPTPKSNNKISAFAAVHAIYRALDEGTLTHIDGSKLPLGVGAGPLYGHNVLGEDYAFPQLAIEGARVATQGMLRAFAGAGVAPSGIIAAILGTAAILEVVHPDSEVGEEYGDFLVTKSSYLAGKSACEAAGLPEKVHMRGTNEEYDLPRLVGDLGIILKDVGSPTVIGMMTFDEMLASFQESVAIGAGFSGGPIMPPLGHLTADPIVVLRALIASDGDQNQAADVFSRVKKNEWIDPELAAVAANTIARKAEQVRRGPVTAVMITATEGPRVNAVYRRAQKVYDDLSAGKSLQEATRALDDERKATVETRCAAILGSMTGHEIEIKITKLAGGARRSHPFAQKFYGFDTDADVELTVDGQKMQFTGLAHQVIPDAVLNNKEDLLQVLPLASIPVVELQLSGHTIINITVPAAVAAAMDKMTPQEAAQTAQDSAYCTAAIPGGESKARAVAELAVRIVQEME